MGYLQELIATKLPGFTPEEWAGIAERRRLALAEILEECPVKELGSIKLELPAPRPYDKRQCTLNSLHHKVVGEYVKLNARGLFFQSHKNDKQQAGYGDTWIWGLDRQGQWVIIDVHVQYNKDEVQAVYLTAQNATLGTLTALTGVDIDLVSAFLSAEVMNYKIKMARRLKKIEALTAEWVPEDTLLACTSWGFRTQVAAQTSKSLDVE